MTSKSSQNSGRSRGSPENSVNFSFGNPLEPSLGTCWYITGGVVWLNVFWLRLSMDLLRELCLGLWILCLFFVDVPCCWNVVPDKCTGESVTLIDLGISDLFRKLGSRRGGEKIPTPVWNCVVVLGYALNRLSLLSCVTFLGGSTTTFGDSGRLGSDRSPTDLSQSCDIAGFRLDTTLSRSPASDPDALELPLVSSSFRTFCSSSTCAFFLSFFSSCSCCRRRNSSSCCCSCKCKPVILLAVDAILFPHVPSLADFDDLAAVDRLPF